MPRFSQLEPLKGVDQVVGKANNFQEQRVGLEGACQYYAQSIILQEFTDARFDRSPRVVEIPDAERGEGKIGDPSAIGVAARGEQSRLPFVAGKKTSRKL